MQFLSHSISLYSFWDSTHMLKLFTMSHITYMLSLCCLFFYLSLLQSRYFLLIDPSLKAENPTAVLRGQGMDAQFNQTIFLLIPGRTQSHSKHKIVHRRRRGPVIWKNFSQNQVEKGYKMESSGELGSVGLGQWGRLKRKVNSIAAQTQEGRAIGSVQACGVSAPECSSRRSCMHRLFTSSNQVP